MNQWNVGIESQINDVIDALSKDLDSTITVSV